MASAKWRPVSLFFSNSVSNWQTVNRLFTVWFPNESIVSCCGACLGIWWFSFVTARWLTRGEAASDQSQTHIHVVYHSFFQPRNILSPGSCMEKCRVLVMWRFGNMSVVAALWSAALWPLSSQSSHAANPVVFQWPGTSVLHDHSTRDGGDG